MRGRRRGRNRPSPPDSLDVGNESASPPGTGSVTLIGPESEVGPPPSPTPTPPAPVAAPDARSTQPSTTTEFSPGTTPPQRRIKETISDVATAHAELDNVLPPTASAQTTPPPPAPRADPRPERVSDTPVAPATGSMKVGQSTREVPKANSGNERAGVQPTNTVIEASPPPPMPEPVDTAPAVSPAPQASKPTPPPASLEEPTSEAEEEPVEEAQAASGNPLPRVLAVANQKGGVGKTTTSVNLGAALAELGFRVLVIDLDPQGNATTGLGIDARNFELSMYDVLMRDSSLEDCVEPTSMKNLFVAPATIALAGAEIELVPAFSRELKLKKSIESVIDEFDYILIDCPPSLGPDHRQRPGRRRRGTGAHPMRVLRVGGAQPAHAQRTSGGVQSQPQAGYLDHRTHHVRRPDEAGRPGGQRGSRSLRRRRSVGA